MVDAPESPAQSQEQTPQKPQYQPGVRTNGRAFNSPNWRMKGEESPSRPQSGNQDGSSPRTFPSFGRSNGTGNGTREIPQAISEGRRLYVGNMPYTAKGDDVKALFEKGGFEVSRIDIAIDPFSSRNPSYCFVDLSTKESAERAMAELDGADLAGRPVRIKPGVVKSASERQQQQDGSPRRDRTTSNSSPFNGDRWRRDGNSTSTTTPTKTGLFANSGSNSNTNADPSKRLYVGSLPRLTEQDDITGKITEFFKDYTVTNVSKLFTPHPAKRFEPGDHYYLFVDFASVDETQNAMAALNGAQGPWGGPIRVQRARGETWKNESGSGSGPGFEERRAGRWGSSTTTPRKEEAVEA
ncbi:hypothetical protein BDV18DRAFT_44169 [Aspergillus unguis]